MDLSRNSDAMGLRSCRGAVFESAIFAVTASFGFFPQLACFQFVQCLDNGINQVLGGQEIVFTADHVRTSPGCFG